MIKLISILLISILSGELLGQDLDDTTLVSFYKITFADYFPNRIKDENSGQFYIQSNSNLLPLNTKFEGFEVYFLTKGEEYNLIKRNKITELYWVTVKTVSKDTIDINIGGWSVDYRRQFKKKECIILDLGVVAQWGIFPMEDLSINMIQALGHINQEKKVLKLNSKKNQNT